MTLELFRFSGTLFLVRKLRACMEKISLAITIVIVSAKHVKGEELFDGVLCSQTLFSGEKLERFLDKLTHQRKRMGTD